MENSIPELPEINFDTTPRKSFEEIKDLELSTWRNLLKNEELWEEGIIKSIFREGATLKFLLQFFEDQNSTPYMQLAKLLLEKMEKYYSG